MIIGLNGRLKSGKDTTCEIIKELYAHAERVSFADALKDSAAAALKLDRDVLEELKNLEEISLRIAFVEDDSINEDLFNRVSDWTLTFREYLQLYGTEAHREIFGDNFWVDQVLPVDIDHHDRLLVITDVRFPNEAERVKELGGVIWKIERSTQTRHAEHPSEQNIDSYVDVFVSNNGTKLDLRNNVEKLLNRMMVPC